MKEPKHESVIRQYLLGQLNDDDREQIEQRLITDRNFMEETLMVEEELLEDYVSQTLAPPERELLLKNYLTAPLQKEKLKIARALEKYASQPSLRTPRVISSESWVRRLLQTLRVHSGLIELSWAALVLVVLIGTWWIVRTWRGDRNGLQAELIQLNGPNSSVLEDGSTIAQVIFPPLNLRETGRSVTLTITGQTQVVQLRIPQVSDQQRRYQAILKDSNGQQLARVSDLRIREIKNEPMVVLQFPAKLFQTADYVVTIGELSSTGGLDNVADYSFRVVRQP